MYGKLTAKAGKRAKFIETMTQAAALVGKFPGCHLYIVHEDLADDAVIVIYELWGDEETHDASLEDARVRALISEAIPLMDGKPEGVKLRVVGGHGVSS